MVAYLAHNQEVTGSTPVSATKNWAAYSPYRISTAMCKSEGTAVLVAPAMVHVSKRITYDSQWDILR